jgi:hypothetical protein
VFIDLTFVTVSGNLNCVMLLHAAKSFVVIRDMRIRNNLVGALQFVRNNGFR